ncbi:MAG: sodium:calcium antiporter [Dehalococcoidia bacterium]
MILVWAKFLVCVLLVLFFGARLSRYADVIAEKRGLSRIWIGLLLLAAVTSLPELITGIGAVAVVGVPDLAMGTIFGSNALNLFIIALLDILYRGGPLLTSAGMGHRLSGGLGILLIAFAGASILLSTRVWGWAIGWVGIYSLVLVLLYFWGSRRIFQFERREQRGQEAGLKALRYERISSRRAYLSFAIAALAIIGSGTWLAIIGDEIAVVTGWGATFVGSFFLAVTTSLPELVVAIAALRLGAIDMAIANMLGSNMFNMGIGIAGFDLFYRAGSIFSAASTSHVFTASIAILMTVIVIAGLISRPQRKTPLGMSWYSIALIGVYIIGFYFLFNMGVAAG